MNVTVFIIASCLCFTTILGCYSQDDCDEGYCCTGGLSPWVKGSCKKYGEKGDTCDPDKPDVGKYFLTCPCRDGLRCVYTSVNAPFGQTQCV
ncbi:U8-theraphotoxin-Hhn1c 1-like [Uloborus diversus]|uniref:U8-theraphotoxin-Hhn1c 1-like n=1 Tax=Uloborus diversus TaxID=327109 RepID=UPI002409FB83|nr:U8-theraphotoxin-Hhn1c 1-like [Uloborus diversus]